ncbi:YceI family protein [Dictyobacter aurantiacus]|uniref:Polyisoprenoid-binding protein n=1 Tax=Dictyobacter aurantiacus TaxID=1936993 RepID=A0A401ZFV2_9CHLR|nr:YceI family protein [Dictyobacter aurantiacus]GCE05742.1 polyisoprenoid-binding protein [Dictyobacter aurantiacus]
MAWEIDPFHTLIEFSVMHLMINVVKGRFKEVHGTLHLDTQQPENSWVKAQVNAASIDTGVSARDGHLRSAGFFDVTRYPSITFESTSVEPTGETTSKVTGNLTLHGVTHPVTFQAKYLGYARDMETYSWRVGLYATTVIDRRQFDISFNQRIDGVPFVGNEARLELFLEALQK